MLYLRRFLATLAGMYFFAALAINSSAASAADFKTYEYYQSTGLDYINAADAYALGYTGEGIILVLCDDPVRLSHLEFSSKTYLEEYPDYGIGSWDKISHGTHVAGIMAASKNDMGMHGVAFDAGIYSLRLDSDGESIESLYTKISNDDSLKIVNNSWGDDYYPEYGKDSKETILAYFEAKPPDETPFREAILGHDKVLVFAAGNNGHLSSGGQANLSYAYPELAGNFVNVVAFDPSKETTAPDFSAYLTDYAMFMTENTIAAPGIGIYSTMPNGNGDEYGYKNGTSMAAPYVSGSLGLVQQAFPYMNGKQLVDTVLSTANNSFELPRYTVRLQGDGPGNSKTHSVYLIYFDDSGKSPEQRDEDLRDYYANSEVFQTGYFGDLDYFLEFYYNNTEGYGYGYGSERYYINVPREIVFGQGLLDVGKAVKGPGLLNAMRLSDADFSDSYGPAQALYSIDTQGYNGIWSNDIGEKRVLEYSEQYRDFYKQVYGGFFENGLYGPGLSYAEGEAYGEDFYNSLNQDIRDNKLYNLPVGLKKEGAGILALTGNNTYTGDSIVTGGILQIDGSVMSNVYSEADGIIAGSGTIGGNLINRGITQAGSWGDVGELTVKGDLSGDGGTIAVTIKNDVASNLFVEGDAYIDGSKVIVNSNNPLAPNSSYTFLSAGTITGEFVQTSLSPFLTINPSSDNTTAFSSYNNTNTASFEVLKTAALDSLPGLNSSQRISAAALENMYVYQETTGQNWANELLGVYNSPTDAIARRNLQNAYGTIQAGMAASLPLQSGISQAVNARLYSSSSVIHENEPDKNSAKASNTNPNNLPADIYTRNVLPFDSQNNWWLKLIGGWETFNSDSDKGLGEMNKNVYGFITGYDKKINKNWRAGALFGYGKGDFSAPEVKGTSRDYRLGLYGNYTRQALDLSAYAAAGRQSHDALRSVLGLRPHSKYNGKTLEVGLKAKYNLHNREENIWQLAPYAALAMQRYNQDAFSEDGAGDLSLQIEKFANTYSTAEFGLEASRKMNAAYYKVSAGYKRILNGENPELRGNFAGNPQEKFPLRSNKSSRDWLTLGLSAEGYLAKNWTIQGELLGQFSGNGNNYALSVSVKRYW